MTTLNKSFVSYTYYLEGRNVLVQFILHSISLYSNSHNVDCSFFLLGFSNELIFMFKLLIFLLCCLLSQPRKGHYSTSTFSPHSTYPFSRDFDPFSLISSVSCQTFCTLYQRSPCLHETLLPSTLSVFPIHILCGPNCPLWPLGWVWVCVCGCLVQVPPLGLIRKGEGGEEGDGEMLLGEGRAEEESCRATSFS